MRRKRLRNISIWGRKGGAASSEKGSVFNIFTTFRSLKEYYSGKRGKNKEAV